MGASVTIQYAGVCDVYTRVATIVALRAVLDRSCQAPIRSQPTFVVDSCPLSPRVSIAALVEPSWDSFCDARIYSPYSSPLTGFDPGTH